MGATTYTIKTKGASVKESFNQLVNEAVDRYGNDPYNGTISTTSLSHEIIISDNLLRGKNKEERLNTYIENNDEKFFPAKWETTYAILGIAHYEAYMPIWENDVETIKIKKGVRTINKYSVVNKDKSNNVYQVFNEYETLTEAKKYAKALALKEGKSMTIKKHRSNGDLFTFGHMNLTSDEKKYKSARSAKNKIYKPIYDLMFFVYASC